MKTIGKVLLAIMIFLMSLCAGAQENGLTSKTYRICEMWAENMIDTTVNISYVTGLIDIKEVDGVFIITIEGFCPRKYTINELIINESIDNLTNITYSGVDENCKYMHLTFIADADRDNRCIIIYGRNSIMSYFISEYKK